MDRMLPGPLGGGESKGRSDACVLKPVVAPQLRSNTMTFHLPAGDLNSSKAWLPQGSQNRKNDPIVATTTKIMTMTTTRTTRMARSIIARRCWRAIFTNQLSRAHAEHLRRCEVHVHQGAFLGREIARRQVCVAECHL